MRRIAIAIVWHCLALLFAQSPALAQPSPKPNCEKSALPIADEALRYKFRGNRCEGLYMQPVAASSRLKIIGYLEHVAVYGINNDSKKLLQVSVAGARQTDPIMLRATSAGYRQYYQMDAQLRPASTFPWDPQIIDEIKVKPDDLMMIACKESCDQPNLHLFPVSIVEDGSPPKRNAPELVFNAAVDLTKLQIQMIKLPNGPTVSREVLQGQQLLAGSPQRVALSAFIKGAGLYRVTATAIPSYTASVSTTQVLIVVP